MDKTVLIQAWREKAQCQRDYGDIHPESTHPEDLGYREKLEKIDFITLQKILASAQAQAFLECSKSLEELPNG